MRGPRTVSKSPPGTRTPRRRPTPASRSPARRPRPTAAAPAPPPALRSMIPGGEHDDNNAEHDNNHTASDHDTRPRRPRTQTGSVAFTVSPNSRAVAHRRAGHLQRHQPVGPRRLSMELRRQDRAEHRGHRHPHVQRCRHLRGLGRRDGERGQHRQRQPERDRRTVAGADRGLHDAAPTQQGGSGASTAVSNPITIVPQASLPQVDSSAQDRITRSRLLVQLAETRIAAAPQARGSSTARRGRRGTPDLTCLPDGSCGQYRGLCRRSRRTVS